MVKPLKQLKSRVAEQIRVDAALVNLVNYEVGVARKHVRITSCEPAQITCCAEPDPGVFRLLTHPVTEPQTNCVTNTRTQSFVQG